MRDFQANSYPTPSFRRTLTLVEKEQRHLQGLIRFLRRAGRVTWLMGAATRPAEDDEMFLHAPGGTEPCQRSPRTSNPKSLDQSAQEA
jgi:hypothetical protein